VARLSPLLLIPPLAFAALAGLFAGQMFASDGSRELPSALLGRPAPALPAEGLAGLPGLPGLDAAALADGEVKLVNFFASWCGPCRIEHPTLAALAAEGIPIYGVAYKDDPERSAAFLRELGNPYAGVGTDPQGRAAVEWGTYGVPETFVIAGDGTVVDRLPMPVTPDLLDSRLRPALAEAAAR
jgi:cytochrome c biogenesis protein CcmG/thiol:disulfide interchange protein DsbE